MGIGVAGGRAIELGERERRAQFEAAGLLLSRDSDGGEERVFGGGRIRRIFLEEDVAARAVDSASNQRCPLRSKSLSAWSSVASAATVSAFRTSASARADLTSG